MTGVVILALLLALLFALTNHGRHNEMIAMRAAGISLARISVPYIAVGLFLSALLFYLNEWLVPDSTQRAETIKKGRQQFAVEDVWQSRVNFRNAHDNRIWNISAFNTETHQLIEPHVEWRLPDGTLKQLRAQRGARTNDSWVFYNLELFTYAPGVDFDKAASRPLRTNILVLPELTDTPENMELQLKFQRMSEIEAAKRIQLPLSQVRYLREHLSLNPRDL